MSSMRPLVLTGPIDRHFTNEDCDWAFVVDPAERRAVRTRLDMNAKGGMRRGTCRPWLGVGVHLLHRSVCSRPRCAQPKCRGWKTDQTDWADGKTCPIGS